MFQFYTLFFTDDPFVPKIQMEENEDQIWFKIKKDQMVNEH